ncbi:hypothetical protein FPZ54_19535 [Sphingomonas suaedae]|uniref:Uncharacterized protein n=2 Tax=Sphingomonas suaedae TaxID=2599297 RepID=A0A518RKN9_9SPHN|nr:hypothetical protein FPZ54_19535 [Sphingomonas suaedae]
MLALTLAAVAGQADIDPRKLFSCHYWSSEDFSAKNLKDENQVLTLNLAVAEGEGAQGRSVEVLNTPNVFGSLTPTAISVSERDKKKLVTVDLSSADARKVHFAMWYEGDRDIWISTVFFIPTQSKMERDQFGGMCMVYNGFSPSMLPWLKEQK